MLSNYTQTINASAMSIINNETVIHMNAFIRGNESPNINVSYENISLYNEHREEVDADFEEFKNMVIGNK